jgi:proteasome lid subunit RPN8/RPN11
LLVELTVLHIQQLKDEAEKVFPAECCGLLIGRGSESLEVTDVITADNMSESSDRFLIDPQVQFDWMRKLRGTERRIVGHYHSHPNGLAKPSNYDEAVAVDRHQVWIIVPIKAGAAGDPKGFLCMGEGLGFIPFPFKIKT